MPDALIVVDVQNDFCPGGSLAVPEGDEVVPVLNRYLERASAVGVPIVASRDWHPAETAHFAAFGGTWPVHCVQGTSGAAFHPALRLPPDALIASKGMSAKDEGYSALEGQLPDGRSVLDALRERGVTRLHVGGLATDYCVRATVLGALAAGFAVALLQDAARAVDMTPGDGERAVAEMLAAGAQAATVEEFSPAR
ncbi:MAG: nicotinamidase [Ktedonobacterales bacterium]